MKIILKYILTNVKEKKIRTIVMLLSIILSTTLLFVSLAIGASYESTQRKMAIGKAGSATVLITNKNGIPVNITDIPDIEQIEKKVGMSELKGLYINEGYYENFDLISGNVNDLNFISPPRIKEGSIDDLKKDSIVLPDRFTDKYKTKIGDQIELRIAGERYQFRVVAIASYDTLFLRSTRGYNALVSDEFISDIKNFDGQFDKIYLKQKSNIDTEVFVNLINHQIDGEKYNISYVYSEASVMADARQKSMPFYLISFFTLVMSTFIIYSSYKIITAERLPVIGTFRSIGATEKMVIHLLVQESLIYGATGGILGIPIGFFTLKLILRGLGESLTEGIEFPIVISAISVVFPIVLAISVSVLGALIPAYKTSRLSVKDIILDNVEERNFSSKTKMIFGLFLFVLSIVLPRIFTGDLLTISGGLSLLTLIIATIIVTPVFIYIFSHIMEKLYFIIFGNIGGLAGRNLRGNKSTNQNVILLIISISSVIVIGNVGGFVNTYIADVFKGASMDGFSQADVDDTFINDVENIEGVKQVLPIYVLNDKVFVNGVSLRVEATGDIDIYSKYFALNFIDKNTTDNIIKFNDDHNTILSTDALKTLGLKVGDSLSINSVDNRVDYKIVGSFTSRANDTGVVLPSIYAKEDFSLTNYGFFGYQAEDPDAVMLQIRDMYKDIPNWSRSVQEFTSDAKQTVGAFLSPLNKLTYFIVLLAAVGIINNLIINFIQKRRIIAMYRSLGLSNKQSVKLTLIEGLSVGIIGAIIATIVSYLEITTVFKVAGPKIAMVPDIEGSTFFTAALMGIVITIIGSVVPIFKTKKMKLVDEIKCD